MQVRLSFPEAEVTKLSFNTNLYKSSWVVMHEQGTRVIDNNALLEEKLSKVRKAAFMEKKEPR